MYSVQRKVISLLMVEILIISKPHRGHGYEAVGMKQLVPSYDTL